MERVQQTMTDGSTKSDAATNIWRPAQTFTMAAVCLLVGLVVGYLLRGSAPAPAAVAAAAVSIPQNSPLQPPASMNSGQQRMPSLEEMKQMADKQAAPLLQKLKSDPKNPALLIQIGDLYKATHQFKSAADYYKQSLEIDPKNVGVRTDMASCLYYTGDVDGALAQLNKSLSYDPKHAGTLLNIGVIRWKGKGDVDGAVASWNKLLQLYPNYERKNVVEHLIAEATKSKAVTQNAQKG